MIVKRYFSKVPGSRVIMPDGHEMHFLGGKLDFDPDNYPGKLQCATHNNQTDDRNGKLRAEVYRAELEHMVNNNNPLIYDEKTALVAANTKLPEVLDPTKNAQSEQAILTQDARLSQVKGVVTGDLNAAANAGQVTDVNKSTSDRELQTLFANAAGPGATADRVAAAKAAAIAKKSG